MKKSIFYLLFTTLIFVVAQENDSMTNIVSRVENPSSGAAQVPAPQETTPIETVTAPEETTQVEKPASTTSELEKPLVVQEEVIQQRVPEVKSEPSVEVAPSASPEVPSTKPPQLSSSKIGLESTPIPEGKDYWYGARFYEKKSGGWGWIRKPNESWRQAKWVAIKEQPRVSHVPHRALKNAEQDHLFQYKLLGKFADYTIYDPHRDEVMEVFIIEGYESLGLQASIERKPGPPARFTSKKSGAYTRRNFVSSDDNDF